MSEFPIVKASLRACIEQVTVILYVFLASLLYLNCLFHKRPFRLNRAYIQKRVDEVLI